jgi:hypothetical protein
MRSCDVAFGFLKFPLAPTGKSPLALRAVPHPQEGRIAIVTDVGRGMRWPRFALKTNARSSDGEVVWS